MPIRLSNRQAKDADRVGGIELMILWPDTLGPEPAELRLDHEREATAAEKAHAEALVRESCDAHGLVPVHVRVTRLVRPTGPTIPAAGEERVHLAVSIIGQRWVRARTGPTGAGRRGRIAWAA